MPLCSCATVLLPENTFPDTTSAARPADEPVFPSSANASPIAILGIPFDHVTLAEAVERVLAMIASGQPHYVVTPNVDFLVQALSDAELRRILVEAHLVLCDGMPLVWASRWLANPLPERVAGADLVPELIRVAAQRGHRLFFLGATAEANANAVANVRRQFPDIIVAGHYSPPFREMDDMEEQDLVERIRSAQPDLLFVAFGCPKAEKWIARNYRSLGVPVVIGVGATIDFLAGQVKRAPAWMQRYGGEWLFRLAQEPRRLFRRYATDLRHFAWELAKQLWLMQSSAWRARTARPLEPARRFANAWTRLRADKSEWEFIAPPTRLDFAAVHQGEALWEELPTRHCALGMVDVNYIDSTGVAMLLRLQNRFRAAHRQFVLLCPSQAVCRALRALHVGQYFFTEEEGAAAPHPSLPEPEESA
jgi:exopolysaccharide biosynthesis WecB/TagA/CpsF family protein/anti-anti-sigma factor